MTIKPFYMLSNKTSFVLKMGNVTFSIILFYVIIGVM